MRLADIAQLNFSASSEGSNLCGTRRLVRDLLSVGLMQEDRLPAAERIEAKLGEAFSRVALATVSGAGPEGLRRHRAA